MSVYCKRREDIDGGGASETAGLLVYRRAYQVAMNKSLSDVSLQLGDTLPDADPANAVIVDAKSETQKNAKGRPGACRIVWVTAIYPQTK